MRMGTLCEKPSEHPSTKCRRRHPPSTSTCLPPLLPQPPRPCPQSSPRVGILAVVLLLALVAAANGGGDHYMGPGGTLGKIIDIPVQFTTLKQAMGHVRDGDTVRPSSLPSSSVTAISFSPTESPLCLPSLPPPPPPSSADFARDPLPAPRST